MTPTLRGKLDELVERHEELSQLLSQPEVAGDAEQLQKLSKEYARLESVVADYSRWHALATEIDDLLNMAEGDDAELRALAEEELPDARASLTSLEDKLKTHLIPTDPNDQANIYLEIRAGAGGDEAALFAGDLLGMYSAYAEAKGWQIELLSASPGEQGGYKEIISRIVGDGAYSKLKFESGAHRVQRVPATESQGRIHTSTCTVAILPEQDQIETIDIDPSDLRVDTYRAAGAGGQHVNTTDSAVRITHNPTGVVVECQQERSQHKNRERAMRLLQTKLLTAEQDKQANERAEHRRALVGTGDRSERIRTYNFPQGRITDHRINLTLYQLDSVVAGNLDVIIDALASEYQADQLAALGAA